MQVGDLVRHVNNGDFYTITSMGKFSFILYDALRDRSVCIKAGFLEVVS